MKDIIKLKNSDLFKGLKEEELEKIFSVIKYSAVSYYKGEILFNEGEECKSIGLVVEGNLQIGRSFENGKEIILKNFTVGDVFGEALVYSNKGFYPATIIAKSNCVVVFIDKRQITKLCSMNEKILENFIALLSDKIIMLNNKVRSTSLKTIKQKVVDYIIENSVDCNSQVIKLNESKEDIATFIGIPRPSLSRELIKLREENLITFDRHKITIVDIKSLKKILVE